MQSGRAYTPEDTVDNATGPIYSKNAAPEAVVNLRLDQGFVFGGRRFTVSLLGENIFNTRVLKRVDPNTGKAPAEGAGQYKHPTEFDRNAVLRNPGNFGPPVRWRIGLDYDF